LPKSLFRVGTSEREETMRRSVVKRDSPHRPVVDGRGRSSGGARRLRSAGAL
jgi:hypothetical protein